MPVERFGFFLFSRNSCLFTWIKWLGADTLIDYFSFIFVGRRIGLQYDVYFYFSFGCTISMRFPYVSSIDFSFLESQLSRNCFSGGENEMLQHFSLFLLLPPFVYSSHIICLLVFSLTLNKKRTFHSLSILVHVVVCLCQSDFYLISCFVRPAFKSIFRWKGRDSFAFFF